MEFNPDQLPSRTVYKLLIGAIVPRPIGWISTVSANGQPNLAPFSYFNVVAHNPPTLVFGPGIRGTDGSPKDTLRNVGATGEFVANIVTEEIVEAMNVTATEFPAQVNEFEAAGLTALPSKVVRPPRVGESPVHFECRVVQIVKLGDHPAAGSLVIGRVVYVHVREDVLFDGDKIDVRRLKPVGRLAGSGYCRVMDLFEMERPPSQIKKQAQKP